MEEQTEISFEKAKEVKKQLDNINVLDEKMAEMDIPGMAIDFDPDEADELGAFEEDALTKEDALEAAQD